MVPEAWWPHRDRMDRGAQIVIDKVNHTYRPPRGRPVPALADVSLEVRPREFLALLGPSGCGKSTLLYLVGGFLPTEAGQIVVEGKPVAAPGPDRGIVFQHFALFPWKTVRGNVEFGLKMKGVAGADRHRIADRFITLVKLQGFENHYPAELSGGMQQRVTLARILAANPEVLLMDEPFAALDAMTRQVMQEELLRIHEESRKTTLFITHHVDEALILADRIIVLSARPGRVKAIIGNTLPRPRRIDIQLSPDFARLKAEIWAYVEEEVKRHIETTKLSAASEE
jgi:NitT/TauT family transport system ATP-binding protein